MQVAKEPLGTKGARLTSHASLAGRFLVFMPTVDHIGVSRKIESREERARLRGIVREYREQQGFTGGIIIRTAAVRPLERGHPHRPRLLQPHLDGGAEEDRRAARARGGLPRRQSGGEAAARSADRRVLRGPDRPPAGTSACAAARRADPAGAGAAGEAVRQDVSDLRGIRGPGRARQGAAQQGLAEVGRVDRRSTRRKRSSPST